MGVFTYGHNLGCIFLGAIPGMRIVRMYCLESIPVILLHGVE